MLDLAYIAVQPNMTVDPDLCDFIELPGGILETITGRDYAAQRVILGLETPQGSNLLAPSLGLPQFPSTSTPALTSAVADGVSALAAYLLASDAWQNPAADETLQSLSSLSVVSGGIAEEVQVQTAWTLADGSTLTWPPTPAAYPPAS